MITKDGKVIIVLSYFQEMHALHFRGFATTCNQGCTKKKVARFPPRMSGEQAVDYGYSWQNTTDCWPRWAEICKHLVSNLLFEKVRPFLRFPSNVAHCVSGSVMYRDTYKFLVSVKNHCTMHTWSMNVKRKSFSTNCRGNLLLLAMGAFTHHDKSFRWGWTTHVKTYRWWAMLWKATCCRDCTWVSK